MSSPRPVSPEKDPAAKPGMADRVMDRLRSRVRGARAKSPFVDHLLRALDRNSEILGFQEAAAVTYFGFLAFFPLLALGFALVGYISTVYPGLQEAVTEAVQEAFPSLIGPNPDQISIKDVIGARRSAGIFGLVGLLIAGLGWLNSLRNALRRAFGTTDIDINFLKRKLLDLGVLALLGVSLLASVIVTSSATAATHFVLDLVERETTLLTTAVLKILSVTLALLADTVLFAILLSRLSGAGCPWRQVRSGAFMAACAFEVLKLVGTLLIARTTANPVYAAFGVVVGLLVWMNLVARVTVFAAAWTVTQPFSLDPGDLDEAAAGRSTPLASATEPVTVVAPADYDQVPVTAGSRQVSSSGRSRGRSMRTFAGGAVAGAAAATLAIATRNRRGGH